MLTAIIGRPRVGKTTLARRLANDLKVPIVHTDDFIDRPWDLIPDALLRAVETHGGNCIIEGVATARLLGHFEFKPDVVYLVDNDWVELQPEHESLATMVFNKVKAWLETKPDCIIHFWEASHHVE